MDKDKLILHRFMSREEYLMYRLGEVLRNDTDHYRGGEDLNPPKSVPLESDSSDHIVQVHEFVEHFAEARKMLRLKIAAQFAIDIMSGPGDFHYYLPGSHRESLIGRRFISQVNRVALIYSDDLIAQAVKGGAE